MTKETNNLVESVTLATSVAYTKKEVTKLREEISELITSLTPEVIYEYVEGPSGKDGLNGVRGEKGDQGEQGPSGKDGINGEKGDRGDKGEQGEQGLIGESGDKGDQGEQGIAGVDGKDGKDGRDGTDGKNGERGIQGEQGPKGDKGEPGIQGVAGQDGKDGIDGKDGRNGVDGKDGTNGKNGRDGKDGKVGPKGDKGDKGDTGEKGERGEPGLAGKDGDSAPLQEKFTKFQKTLEQDLNNYKNKINAVITTKGFGGETAGSGSYWLNDLGDTDKLSIENATDGQVLTFSASEGKWVAANGVGGGTTDNTARTMAQAAYDAANGDLTLLATELSSNDQFLIAVNQSQNTVIGSAYSTANSAYNQSNTGTVLAQAAFDYANTIPLFDQSARNTANNALTNTINIGNNITLNVQPELSYSFNVANSATALAQAAFNYANTIPLLDQTARNIGNSATTLAQSAYNYANTIPLFDQTARNLANTADVDAINAGTYANAAFVTANTASSNTVYLQGALNSSNANIILAYAQANTGTVLTQAAFNTANLASSNTVISQGVDLTQNTNITAATTLAQNAYNEANLAYSTAQNAYSSGEEGQIIAQASYNTGNSAFITANSAFSKANNALANTTGTFNGGLTFGSAAGNVNNGMSNTNYVSVGSGHSQLFDDGNLHLHANSGSIWINSLDSSSIRVGTQYNSGSGSGLYVQGGVQTATTDPSQSSFFTKEQTNWNVNQPSLSMDNLNVRLYNSGGNSLLIEASAISGSFTAYVTTFESVAGQSFASQTNSSGITFTAGTWTSINAVHTLSSGGDTIFFILADTTTGKIYRVTCIHTNGNTNGSIFIERMV